MNNLKIVSIVLIVIIAVGCGGRNAQPKTDVDPAGVPSEFRSLDRTAAVMGVLCVGGVTVWALTSSPWIAFGLLGCFGFFGYYVWDLQQEEVITPQDPDPIEKKRDGA